MFVKFVLTKPQTMSDTENNKRFTFTYIAAIAITIGGILTMIFYFKWISPIHFNYSGNVDIGKASKVGDFIGGVVGTLFALVGVFLLYETLRLQRKEFKDNREVFKNQQFENSFFQMLTIHNDIVNSTDIHKRIRDEKGKIKENILLHSGRDSFRYFYVILKVRYRKLKYKSFKNTINTYEVFFDKWEADLGHYFRNLYHIMKYIDENGPKELGSKKVYINILRSTLSSSELLLLFYNCMSDYGKDRSLPLIVKYNFLNNLPRHKVLDVSHLNEYKKLEVKEKFKLRKEGVNIKL